MIPALDHLNLRDAGSVARALRDGADANLRSPCRVDSIEVIGPGGELVATGDLHDNPLHMARVVRAAGLADDPPANPRHVTLHELIHPDHLTGGLDFSYRALARAAALKSAFPAHVHTLLANHELAQVTGSGIVKDGVKVVDAFNDGVAAAFGDEHAASDVLSAVVEFVKSMPLALRCLGAGTDGKDLLCAHSLPAPELMDRFDPVVLERPLHDDDYIPRRGSAHLMVWGRNWTAPQVEALSARWNVGTFVLGHEKAEQGWFACCERVVVLNSDHDRGIIATLDLSRSWTAAETGGACRPLAEA